jgi:spore germination cell wall hydrolase CwlJ-like protein
VIAGIWHKENKMKMHIKYLLVATIILVLMFGFTALNVNNTNLLIEKAAEPVAEVAKVAKIVDPKQLACMAKNIFYEANGEPIQGQAAVARVVMNRIQHGFGSNPCNVIYQATYVEKLNEEGDIYKEKRCQFSWVCEGKDEPNKNNPGYIKAKEIAYDVLAYDAYDDVIPKSTLFFHNLTVKPNWPYQHAKQIGNHIFYSKSKKKKQNKLATQ